MRANKKFVFVVTHLFPYPPTHGTELRILKLMKALKTAGYQVVLVLSERPRQKEHLNQLRKLVAAIHWVGPSLRTRMGHRFPRLRQHVWEKVKPLLPPTKMGGNSVASKFYGRIPSAAGDERK